MSKSVVTSVDAKVDAEHESDLIAGYRRIIAGDRPEGLLRSELLRGQDGAWRIQSAWRDLEALNEVRNSGSPPAALALFESVGAEHSFTWFVVENGFDSNLPKTVDPTA